MKRLGAYKRDQERFFTKNRERLYVWVDSHDGLEKSAYLATATKNQRRMVFGVPRRYKYFDLSVEILISLIKYSIRIYFLVKQYINRDNFFYDFYYFFLFIYICCPISFFFFWTIYIFIIYI